MPAKHMQQTFRQSCALVAKCKSQFSAQVAVVQIYFCIGCRSKYLTLECRSHREQIRMLVDAEDKMPAHAGTQHLGRPGIGTALGQEHRVASRSRSGTQHGTKVAGVLYIFQKQTEIALRG